MGEADMEEHITIILGADRLTVYYEALVEGAIVHGARRADDSDVSLTNELRDTLETIVVAHLRSARATYTEARHGKAKDAARPNRPDQRWAGYAGRARRSA
jgi:hypothetical protein